MLVRTTAYVCGRIPVILLLYLITPFSIKYNIIDIIISID